jgi:hypothetical protein
MYLNTCLMKLIAFCLAVTIEVKADGHSVSLLLRPNSVGKKGLRLIEGHQLEAKGCG